MSYSLKYARGKAARRNGTAWLRGQAESKVASSNGRDRKKARAILRAERNGERRAMRLESKRECRRAVMEMFATGDRGKAANG